MWFGKKKNHCYSCECLDCTIKRPVIHSRDALRVSASYSYKIKEAEDEQLRLAIHEIGSLVKGAAERGAKSVTYCGYLSDEALDFIVNDLSFNVEKIEDEQAIVYPRSFYLIKWGEKDADS
jgi:hypothetical protein